MRNGDKCEGVIFDMDGVLIDSHPVHKKVWAQFLASLNMHVSDQELDYVLDGRRREEILRHFLGDLSPERIREYGQQKNELYKESERDLRMVSGIVEFLDTLQAAGIRMAVATSASSVRAHDILARLGILPRFRAVVTGNDVAKGKPDPEIFVQAADQLNLSPRNVLVVEDAVSGVKAAKSAGMKCLGIAVDGRKNSLREAGADCVIPDYRKISLREVQQLF
jgi:beta-phosphoglucomutase family hydrolase